MNNEEIETVHIIPHYSDRLNANLLALKKMQENSSSESIETDRIMAIGIFWQMSQLCEEALIDLRNLQ